MASLQRIRNHGALLILIVGVAMLAFILGDFLRDGGTLRNRDRENIGEIAGNKIHFADYQSIKDQYEELYKIELNQNSFNAELESQIRNEVWNSIVSDNMFREEFKKIGMDITNEELTELCLGDNPHRFLQSFRMFRDENGQFNREMVKQLVSFINEEDPELAQNPNIAIYRKYWMAVERLVRLNYAQEKYNSVLQHTLKTNTLDAEFAFNNRQKGISAEYVMKPYYAVADSLVSVSESEIKALYKNHYKDEYKKKPTRSIQYIQVEKTPSEADYQKVKELMESLQEEFRTSEDVSIVVNPNSDIVYDGRNYSEETIPVQFKDFAFGKESKTGDCTELLFDGKTYSMARIMETGYSMPDSVELKIIEEEGEGREMGWVTEEILLENKWPKDFIEKAFSGKRGSQFTSGSRTFEIMEVAKATPKVKVAILSQTVIPSDQTNHALYQQMLQFANDNKTIEAFEASAQEAGYALVPAELTEMDDKVGSVKDSREIVRWAFGAKEGAVSDKVYECGNLFVLAALTEADDNEYRMAYVHADAAQEALNNAKAKYLVDQLKGVESLEAASEILGQPIRNVERVTLNDNFFGNSNEPAVIGAALAQGENVLSAPICGESGVFVVKTGAAINTSEEFDAEKEKAQLGGRNSYRHYELLQLLQDETEIEDNRANFL